MNARIRSTFDAHQSFCRYVRHGRARLPAHLQDASYRQANNEESAEKHTERD
jgi:hypothetical protein